MCPGMNKICIPTVDCCQIQVRCQAPYLPAASSGVSPEQEIQSLAAGGTVSFACPHGYRLEGPRLITCLANKTWSHMPPTCGRIYCPPLSVMEHGTVNDLNREYRGLATYSCDPGHTLQGPRTRSCLHTGQWGGTQPACKPNLCPVLKVQHGSTSIKGHAPGDSVTITCDLGFWRRGPARLVCQMDLEWSSSPPSCHPVRCSDPPNVQHAKVVGQARVYLSSIYYRCNAGYEPRGTNRLTCSVEGTWSGPRPSCVPRPCGYLEAPPHTAISFSSPTGHHLGFGSTARLACLSGFVALSPSQLRCEEDGVWRGEVSPCLPVPCGSPPVPANGQAEVVGMSGLYHAQYSCFVGHSLLGASSLLCRTDSTWQFGM